MRATVIRALPLLLLLAATAVALAPAPARADDRSVKAAWDSEDPAFAELGRKTRGEMRRWARRDFTRDARLLRLLRRGERLTRVVEGRVEAEAASSETGARAREIALVSLDVFARYFRAERRWVRAMRPRPARRVRRLERRVIRLDRRARAKAREARELFAGVGVE